MRIFEAIKNGLMPKRDIIIKLLKDSYEEENSKEEINKYLDLLEKAYPTASSIQEKVFINDVIFVLNLLSRDKEEAINKYLDKLLILNIHKISDDDIKFFDEIIEIFGVEIVIDYINNRLFTIDNLDKESLRSFFNWIMHKIWTAKSFLNNSQFMLLYENLKSLLYKLIEQNRTDEVMYLEFFIYHIMGNNYQTQKEWKKFNEEINRVCADYYAKYAQTHNLIKPNPTKKEKIRIALIRDRIVNNSPFMVEYSLLKALQENKEFKEKYEIAVYSLNYFEKAFDDQQIIKKLLDIGIPVISPTVNFVEGGYYNNHLEKALKIRQTLIEDNIDIIINGSGYDIMGFLYATRTAPKQIYWSHGNCSYDVPGIDKRISHFEQECKEFEWDIFNVPMAEEFLIGSEEEKKEGEKVKKALLEKFGKDTVILGTIGRLVKIDSDEYLKTIAEIMKQNPNTIYLACGVGNIENIKEKLKKYEIDLKRVVFTGMVNPHIYGWVIDVWPDSFPLGQGQSKDEFIAKKRPVIFHVKRNVIRTKEDKLYVAENDVEYISMINSLIQDSEKKEKMGNLEYKIRYKKRKSNFLKLLK